MAVSGASRARTVHRIEKQRRADIATARGVVDGGTFRITGARTAGARVLPADGLGCIVATLGRRRADTTHTALGAVGFVGVGGLAFGVAGAGDTFADLTKSTFADCPSTAPICNNYAFSCGPCNTNAECAIRSPQQAKCNRGANNLTASPIGTCTTCTLHTDCANPLPNCDGSGCHPH